ncbi:uncharacterized protein G2W53_031422 [Senna tora]|uniref:Uncharacterized protein n=1 Tax=Senna tora TaxID=362788 RepID=A0A834T8T2_9FABA|nr:uncharacterized protein G2W53_031422 [Senna tora]
MEGISEREAGWMLTVANGAKGVRLRRLANMLAFDIPPLAYGS